MKQKTLAFIVLGISVLASCSNNKVFELPLTEKNGYGPFAPALGGISTYSEDSNNVWKKTYLKVSGAPKDWTEVKFGDIETNIYQQIYQSYLLGNISDETYKNVQLSWNWKPDTLNLSKKPIKTKIAFAIGKDSTGTEKMIVDANNNLDLSDDKPFIPAEINLEKKNNQDSLAQKNAVEVTFERYQNHQIVTAHAPLFVVHAKQYNLYMSNFPQHKTTNSEGIEIAVCSNGFTNLSYDNPGIVLMNDSLKQGKKAGSQNVVALNEYFEMNGKIYRNKGFNPTDNALVLEKISLPKDQLASTQIGYQSFPFSGKEFKTMGTISSEGLKGKYVLLDFWAVWCGPCVQEIPNLKKLYEKTDRSKFEIVGIVAESPTDVLDKMIGEQSISWPQVLSDQVNKIKETYEVNGFPTSFLINPEGVIVAKNLRGKELEDKVLGLLGK